MDVQFLPDGSFDVSTPELALAAAECALHNIAIIPQAYNERGAEFCRDEMLRIALAMSRQLKERRK